VYPGWYAVTAAQLVAMVEWLRRLAGRPERPVPAGATSFGPISIGPLDRFGEMFSFVEQEIWHALGMFRPEPSKCDFEQYLKP